jgi:hypothetical protein
MAMTRMMTARQLLGEDPPSDPDREPAMVSPLVALLRHQSCPTMSLPFDVLDLDAGFRGQRRGGPAAIRASVWSGVAHRDSSHHVAPASRQGCRMSGHDAGSSVGVSPSLITS